jgi:hypothetical protein
MPWRSSARWWPRHAASKPDVAGAAAAQCGRPATAAAGQCPAGGARQPSPS